MENLSFLTTPKFVRGQILSWLMPSFKISPVYLPGYTRIRSLKRSQGGRSETILCEKNEKRLIVKILFAFRWTLEYEYLLNQASMNSILSDIKTKSKVGHIIGFPRAVCFSSGAPFVLVREFADGEPIEGLSISVQREILLESICALRSATNQIPLLVKGKLPRRSNMLMLISFPVYAAISLFRKRASLRTVIKSIVLFVKLSPSISWFNTEYVLAHRDLHSGNILVRDSNITIIDTEAALLAEEGVDMAISFPRYYDWSNIKSNIEYLKQSVSPDRYGKFILLSIFYMMQFIASDTSSEEGLVNKTKNYLAILVESIAPALIG